MKHYIYRPARRQLIKIWHYTDQNWGENQANKYIKGIQAAIDNIIKHTKLWRKVDHEEIKGVFFIRYQRHFIFFRMLSRDEIGIVSILHEQMNIPNRLKEDLRNIK